MTPAQLTKEIGTGRFRPVYYFYGDEDFRKAEAVKYILANYLPQQQRLLNHIRLEAERVEFEKICAELSVIPMLGERKLVQIDEPQRLKPTQQKKFLALLVPPPPETVIILTTSAAHTPRRDSAFFRDFTQIAEPIQFDRLDEGDVKGRIMRHLEKNELTGDPEAVQFLAELTDGDFGGLTAELEKLTLMAGPRGHIGLAEVKELASSYQEFNIFQLIDLIIGHESDNALLAYQELLLGGMSPVGILNILSGQLINLVKIHAGKKIAGAPFYVNKLKRQAGDFSREQVLTGISLIAVADRDIRRSALAPEMVVENLIREISR